MRTTIDFGRGNGSENFLLTGWSNPEETIVWSNGVMSTLRLPRLPGSPSAIIRMRMQPYLSARKKFQIVQISVNSTQVASLHLKEMIDIELFVDFSFCKGEDTFEVQFRYLCPSRPCDVSDSRDPRMLSIALAAIEVSDIEIDSRYRLSTNLFGLPDMDATYLRAIRESDVDDANRFADIRRTSIPLTNILEAYLRGVGSVMQTRQRVRDNITTRLEQEKGVVACPFSKQGLISNDFVREQFPELGHLVCTQANNSDVIIKNVWDQYTNDLQDSSVTLSYGHTLTETVRPRFDIYVSHCAWLFVDSYSFLVLQNGGKSAYRQVISQDLSTECLVGKQVIIEGMAVLLQDRFDGGNSAHFLYDSVTRMIHFCREYPDHKSEATFIFGGWPSELHRLILRGVAELCNVRIEQCLFPGQKMILRPTRGVCWFSDQEWYHHPAQRMHKRSASILRELASLIGSTPVSESKIYISRSDASLRKLVNEDELKISLAKVGFRAIEMSTMSYEDQLKTVSSASCIVAPHGMGLTPIAFNRGKPLVVELFNPMLGSDAYAWISRGLGFNHKIVVGKETDTRTHNFSVDAEEVMANLT